MNLLWMIFVLSLVADEINVSANEGAVIHKWTLEDYLIPEDKVPLKYTKEQPLLWSENCQRSSIFIHNEMVYLHSRQETEGKYAVIVVPKTVVKSTSRAQVSSVAFAASNLLLVVEGAVLTYDLSTGMVIPAGGIHGNVSNVASHQCCYGDHQWCQDNSNIVIAYSDLQDTSSKILYYISFDGGRQFQARHIHVEHLGHVYGGVILHSHSNIAFLIKTDSDTARFVYDSYKQDRTPSSPSKSGPFVVESGGSIGVKQLQSGLDSMLIWDEANLFYSVSSGSTVLMVDVYLSGGISSAPLAGQQVQQVVAEKHGNFAVLTDKGRLLYGREHILSQAIEVTLPIPCNHSCLLQWKDPRHLSIMLPVDSASKSYMLEMTSLDINMQQLSAKVDSTTCMFQAFTGDFHDHVYYLDIGSSLNITATFVPEKWKQNWFMVGVSNPGIAVVQSSSREGDMLPTGLRQISVNAQVDVVASGLPNGSKEIARGISALWMTAMNTSLTCPHNPMLVAQIAAECPPYKHIRLRNEETSCDEMKTYSYTIKKDHYDSSFVQDPHISRAQEDKTVMYDYVTLGCPVRKYYGDTFKPRLDLYDGDTFVEEVLVDYVIYEVHGVTTYAYTKTAAQIGCVSSPQSWVSMLMQQSTPDPDTAWTRLNYQSCFNNGSQLSEPGQMYEVLNNQTKNALRWDDYNTIYVFHATVVDPDYSFCHLTTTFAVQVYGALPQAAVLPLRIMLTTCAIGLGILAAVYLVHNVYGAGKDDRESEQNEEDH